MDVSSVNSLSMMFRGMPSQGDVEQMQADAMAEYDVDGSGGLSFDEAGETTFGNKVQDNFGTIDADGDGELTQTEMTDFITNELDKMMQQFGGATGAESQSLFDALLDALDGDEADDNGAASTTDVNAANDAYQDITAMA